MELPFKLLLYLVILVIVLTVNGFSRAWVGHMLGDINPKVEGKLSLNPLVHIDPFMTLLLPLGLVLLGSPIVFGATKPMPFNPYAFRLGKWGAALVAIAGPASNLLMAILIGTYLRFVNLDGLAELFLIQFVLVNVAFFLFNMIPFPPLDGSRVLYAVAPLWLKDTMDRLEQYGSVAIFAFVLIFFMVIGPVFSKIVFDLSSIIVGKAVF